MIFRRELIKLIATKPRSRGVPNGIAEAQTHTRLVQRTRRRGGTKPLVAQVVPPSLAAKVMDIRSFRRVTKSGDPGLFGLFRTPPSQTAGAPQALAPWP